MKPLLEVFTHVCDEGHWYSPASSMIEYFLRYYQTVADKITVCVDAATSDDTRDLCRTGGAEVETWRTDGDNDTDFVKLAGMRIAQSQALYAAWPDCDEFIVSQGDLREDLANHAFRGDFILQPGAAYAMVSETFPTTTGQIFAEVKRGFADPSYQPKPVIISPRVRVRWAVGKHALLSPHAPIVEDSRWQYRHYRYLGADYNAARNARNWARVPQAEKNKGHGIHCSPAKAAEQRAQIATWLEGASEI